MHKIKKTSFKYLRPKKKKPTQQGLKSTPY